MNHGLVSTYTNLGCRCPLCSEARRTYKRGYDLKKRYGMTLEDFDKLLSAQDGNCGICRDPLTGKACVDHCHETGLIRGLLCLTCNLGIGHARDDPKRIRDAIEYLFLVN